MDAFLMKVPENGEGRLDGMMIHHDGRQLSGTMLGMQVVPPITEGQTEFRGIVVPIPNDLPRCNYVRISPDGRWLYAAHAEAILRRELDPGFARKPGTP